MLVVNWNNKILNLSLNYTSGLDGISLLFIILSTFNCIMCLASSTINIENVYFLFIISNRIGISKRIFSDGNIFEFLCIF